MWSNLALQAVVVICKYVFLFCFTGVASDLFAVDISSQHWPGNCIVTMLSPVHCILIADLK